MGGMNGLLASSAQINAVSNNIANASTIGYKSSKPIFFDMVSHSCYSHNATGYGVEIFDMIQNFNDGALVETGKDLDLGISKAGFFRVVDSQGHTYYTRDGQFLLDKDQNIVNMQGMYVTGRNQSFSKNSFNNNNNISSTEPINLKHANILTEQPTTEITLQVLLNSKSKIVPETNNNSSLPTDGYTHYVNIFKKNGEEEKISITFNKKDENIWQVQVASENDADRESINNNFELKFNSNGELVSNANVNIQSNNSKYNDINLNLTGTIEKPDIHNSAEQSYQNGYAIGELKAFNISPNGEIVGSYSNNQQKVIGQILLSKFVNPERLQPENGNLWSATIESGRAKTGVAGEHGFGIINSKNLETSNVDLNKELINMIIAQRNYQSNAQSFKAEDKMINTLINLR